MSETDKLIDVAAYVAGEIKRLSDNVVTDFREAVTYGKPCDFLLVRFRLREIAEYVDQLDHTLDELEDEVVETRRKETKHG